jgi:hypothetical protein
MNDKDENEENSKSDRFKILDFDGKPIFGKEEANVEKSKAKDEPHVSPKETAENSGPKQITSFEELSPEIKKTMKDLIKSIPKEEVKQLLNEMQAKKEILFDKENKSAFGKLNEADQNILIEKMAEWEVPDELSNLNASVILSWLNNTIKEGKK